MTNDEYRELCCEFAIRAAWVHSQARGEVQNDRFIGLLATILTFSLMRGIDSAFVAECAKLVDQVVQDTIEKAVEERNLRVVTYPKKEPSAGSETTQETPSSQTGDTTSGGAGQ